MPILLLPHIPSAATETIPLFLFDLHFAGMVGLEGFEPSTLRL